MTWKSDWQAVHQEMMAADRGKLGDELPTVEEIFAYGRGELQPADEARVRTMLVSYPDLARAFTAPFPADEAKPGDDGFLSEMELARQWKALRKRIQGARAPERRLRFAYAGAAIAAALMLVFAALLWRSDRQVRELTHTLSMPRMASDELQLLRPGGSRGPGDPSTTLIAQGAVYPLGVPLFGQVDGRTFQLEIVDVATGGKLWRSELLQRPGDDDPFRIDVPRAFLKPGRYDVVLYGEKNGRMEEVATYPVRVTK